VVAVVPVRPAGVLLVRRVAAPAGLALPSGFVELGELWQDALVREVAEETGVELDRRGVRELRVRSGTDGTLLVFAAAAPVGLDALTAFRPSAEISELIVGDGPRDDLVFPLDRELVADWFAAIRRPRVGGAGPG
jgi:8-oxo-dGTP pyrophosphatase MutT (NUDIX family)